jgi:ubiquitin-protein ligase E3 A
MTAPGKAKNLNSDDTYWIIVDNYGLMDWLGSQFPNTFPSSVAHLAHANPECESRIFILDNAMRFSIDSALQSVDWRRETLVVYMRMVQAFHSIGLQVPWNTVRLWTPTGFGLGTDTDLNLLTRAGDDRTQLSWLIGEFSLAPFYPEADELSKTLTTSESEEYDTWIEEILNWRRHTLAESIEALMQEDDATACEKVQRYTDRLEAEAGRILIELREQKKSVGEIWNAIGGPALVKWFEEKHAACGKSVFRALNSLIQSVGINNLEFTETLLDSVMHWKRNGLCAKAAPDIESSLSLNNVTPFLWMMCPVELLLESQREIKPAVRSALNEQDLKSLDRIRNLWNLFALPELLESNLEGILKRRLLEFTTLLVSEILRNLGKRPFDLSVEEGLDLFPGLDRFCPELTDLTPGTASLVWLCSKEPIEQFCKSTFLFPNDSQIREVNWAKDGFVDMELTLKLPEIPGECRDRLLLSLVYSAMHKVDASKEKAPRIGAETFADLVFYCTFAPSFQDPVDGLLLAWLCGNPVEQLCRILPSGFDTEKTANRLFGHRQLLGSQWVQEIKDSRLFDAVPKAPIECQRDLVLYVVGLLGSDKIPKGILYEVPRSRYICKSHKELILSFPGPEKERICPHLFVADEPENEVKAKAASIYYKPGNGRLEVLRETAFTDSFPLLLSKFADQSKPGGLGFIGEAGVDASGVRRSWVSRVAAIVTGACESDPHSGLFKLKPKPPGVGYYEINPAKAHDRDGWFAFGKFMAIVLIKGDQMGVELPKYFFAKFLSADNRVSDLDLIPEEEATVTGLQKPLVWYWPTDENPDGVLELDIDEISGDPTEVTYANQGDVLKRFVASFNRDWEAEPLTYMRQGFETLLKIESVRKTFSAHQLRLMIVGAAMLDVDELKKVAKQDSGNPEYPKQSFDWLFEWLKTAPRETQKMFMRFVTGSTSLTVTTLQFSGIWEPNVKMPVAHTCFSHIELPNFSTKQELIDKFEMVIPIDTLDLK